VWEEIETAVGTLDLMGADRLPELTHGVCPVCSEMVRGEIIDE
jgi:hypothetical protein